ncbi:aminotransferase class I/II-fold pyridoxal phosphate-dependent enzyme [bacterium AH-315-J04]|nr:aminotransferase class I/II-fold pyridoxal phosphate-dependent enzyme [bacterium AH-315-J04]
MNDLVHNYISGNSAVKIAHSIESAVRESKILSGAQLPTVRALSEWLEVAPATVASAYQTLQARGVVVSRGRRGTSVSHRPVPASRRVGAITCEGRNLRDGNPDPKLLPGMKAVLRRIDSSHHLYGEPPHDASLVKIVSRDMKKSGVAVGDVCVTSGAMDALERVMTERLKPGDRVIVEDPGFGNTFDLVLAHGLVLVPVPIDQESFIPSELARACRDGAQALIMTPRAQNPTGAVLSEARSRELRKILRQYPSLLIIEDDHKHIIADAPLNCLHDHRTQQWVHIRSFSKSLNPDLRMAVMTGDEETMARVQDRFVVGDRWVSHILQRITAALLSDKDVRSLLKAAAKTYSQRRKNLIRALRCERIDVESSSGFNVWIPVKEETATVQALAAVGWAVSAGERFRLSSPPAIRVCTATLSPQEAKDFASVFARVVSGGATACAV